MSRKDVHAEALCEHVNLLKPLTTRSAFFRACAEFKRDELEDLDLAHGRQVTANGKLALKSVKIFIPASLIAFMQNVPVTRRVRKKRLELKRRRKKSLRS